ncbi:MAG: hypothetical protein KAI66_18905 [Lentisphaeria bacterium]|nr:hypothetical protein [Lentisphaeria bacterium]
MTARYDFHTHTVHLKCANETMTIPAMVVEAARLGVTKLGITDHLNTFDKLPLHECIRADIDAVETSVDIYLGVELNYMGCDGEFAYNEETRDKLGFQFAIGGIHATYLKEYDLGKIIDIQHRHHLATCENPLVDVLVHPYWFGKYHFDREEWPWFDSVACVPESYARELGQVAKETNTAIEINGSANLVNSGNPPEYVDGYADYLAIVAEQGCLFSVGSDAHDIKRMSTVEATWAMVERLGLPDDRIWSPKCAPYKRA